MSRISGPLLDRIDIQIEMATVSYRDLTLLRPVEETGAVRVRVGQAWERQRERYREHPRVLCNAEMDLSLLREHCRLGRTSQGLLRMAMERLRLSPRAYHRVLRLARTIADLGGVREIAEEHVAEAVAYRVLDRGVG